MIAPGADNARPSPLLCDVEAAIQIRGSSNVFFFSPRHWSMPFKPTIVSALLWNMLMGARWDLASPSHGDALMSLAVSGSSLKQPRSITVRLLSALLPHVSGTSVYRRSGAILLRRDCISTRVPPFTWCRIPRSKGDFTVLLSFSLTFLNIMSIWPPCGVCLWPNGWEMPIMMMISHYFVILYRFPSQQWKHFQWRQ